MKAIQACLVFLLFLGGILPPGAPAADWPKVEKGLARWGGSKDITLRTDLADPLASPVVHKLLETLLEQGYSVVPAPVGAPGGKGLVLDLRTSEHSILLTLSRSADGVILALEQSSAGGQAAAAPVVRPAERGGRLHSPLVELAGQPRQVLYLGAAAGGGHDIALLSDDVLERFRLSGNTLAKTGEFRPPFSSARALYAEVGDLDDDGTREIAVIWAEDIRGVYEGTDSRIHGWVLGSRGEGLERLSEDLEGYVRIVGAVAYYQRRGAFSPFADGVFALVQGEKGLRPGSQAVPWGKRNLFAMTPLSKDEAIAWTDGQRLDIVSPRTGIAVPGTLVMKDFGDFVGASVAVRLENPEYRSGFAKEDQVKERYYPLPRRLRAKASGDTWFTVARGRSEGLPLVGRPSGSDYLVAIDREGDRLTTVPAAEPVEAFVLDFDLVAGQEAFVLLLGEKADGSGKAYLMLQPAG